MAKKPTTNSKVNPEHENAARRLIDVANELRHTGKRADLAELLAAAHDKQVRVTWQDIYALNSWPGRGDVVVIPPFISEFLSAYATDRKPKSILDPWAGIGSLLLPIVEKNTIPIAKGISPIQAALEVAQRMDEHSAVEWMHASGDAVLAALGTFDLVVSSPPLGLHPVSAKFTTNDGEIEARDSETYIGALKAALHLTEAGEAIFIFPNGFFFSDRSASLREVLPKVGLFINAVIALPAGAFSHTSIELNLVFMSRHSTLDLFVGRLSPEQEPKALLSNLKKRRAGPAPELGRLVANGEYRGWRTLVAADEMTRLVERSGLVPVPLADIVQSVNLADRKNEENPFEDLPNSVYVPLIGTSPAVSALSNLKIKPHDYAQLVIEPDKAYAEFVARFFNAPLGRKLRDGLLRGAFIPKINKQSLLEATVYVLPLEAQRAAVDAGREIGELRLQLEQFENALWIRPADAPKLRKALSRLNQKEGFEAWLETLPFPLSSILQRYNASINPEHKVAHLLNFFEAAAQFLGALMTSVFHSDPQFFKDHKHEWFEVGKDNPHSLARSNFGEWVVRGQRLAKTTRKLLSSEKEEERDFCMSLYRVSDPDKIGVVADKDLYALLERVSKYRNAWKGHSGIISKKDHESRLMVLQEELTRLRGVLGTVFEDWWLIRPGANEYSAGIFHYRADRLMGSHQIFKQVQLESTAVMDSTELYFFDNTTRQPLRLVHFFRMMAVPESEEVACYFFNRLEKTDIRWVSYHFEGKAERTEPDTSVLKLIEEVEQNGRE
jgi:hypothetical protein